MTATTINRIQIEKGRRYWVDVCGEIRSAKVLKVVEQHGAQMVKFRVGIPIFGRVTFESAAEFWRKMKKV